MPSSRPVTARRTGHDIPEKIVVRCARAGATPRATAAGPERAQRTLERQLGRPVAVDLRQYQVGVEGTTDGAELALARMQELQAASREEISDLTNQLALIAGVDADEVTVDYTARRALVRVRALPGAELRTYQALEPRASARAEGWDVQTIPPAKALPPISFTDGEPDAGGSRNVNLAIWAARRIGVPVGVTGDDAQAAAVIALFAEAGINAVRVEGTLTADRVQLRWMAPDDGGAE